LRRNVSSVKSVYNGFDLDGGSGSLFRTDNRTPIDLIGGIQGDFPGIYGSVDLSVGSQLVRRKTRVENNLDFYPERIETVSLNCVQDTDERFSAGQSGIGHIDYIDRTIVSQQRLLGIRRQFFEVNREQVVIIVGRH